MNELEQLYTSWSNHQSDSMNIKDTWNAIDQFLSAFSHVAAIVRNFVLANIFLYAAIAFLFRLSAHS